jgi:hypothetical protein
MEKIYAEKVAPKGSVEPDRFKVRSVVCEKKLTKKQLGEIIASKNENLVVGSISKDVRIQPLQDFKREDFEKILTDAGLKIDKVLKPYEPGSTSSQFETYIVKDEEGNEYPVVLGKGKGSTLRAESFAMSDISEQIANILNDPETTEDYFIVELGGKEYKVNGVSTTEGSPKSDFSLDYNKEPEIFISHKDGNTPKNFQQYGGLTKKSGEQISSHPEVEKFVNEVKTRFPNGLSSRQHYFKEIEDNNLKLMSIYGSDYGSEKFGRNNVSVVLQGRVVFVKKPGKDNTYELSANKIMPSGTLPEKESPYDPMLFVRFSESRPGNYDVKNGRFMVVPRGFIASKIEQDKILRRSIDALSKSETDFGDLLLSTGRNRSH